MALGLIYNVPETEDEWRQWSWNHMAHHRDIIRLIYQVYEVAIEELVLDPLILSDSGVWRYNHQIMHNQMDQQLSIAGFNLLDVELLDRRQREIWIDIHGQEHLQAATILGV